MSSSMLSWAFLNKFDERCFCYNFFLWNKTLQMTFDFMLRTDQEKGQEKGATTL